MSRLFNSTHRTARWVLSALLVCTFAPWVALAQPTNLEERENRAVALRAEGRTQEALEVLREVFDAGHLPRTQARIGLAETNLGRWVSAENDLQTALAASSDPFISTNRAALEATLAAVRAHLGSLEVLCSQRGAEVWIEGSRAASLPLSAPLRVAAGSWPIEVRSEGYYSVVRTVTVAAGQIVRESVELMPIQTAREVHALPPIAQPVVHVAQSATSLTAPVAPPRGDTRRVNGWWLAGGAAFFAVGGSVALGLQRSVGTRFNSECSLMYEDALTGHCTSLRSSADTASTLAVTGFAVAGALAVTAAVLLLLPSQSGARRAAGAVCGVVPGALEVSCAATF